MSDETTISRRGFIAGVGGSGLILLAQPGFAATSAKAGAAGDPTQLGVYLGIYEDNRIVIATPNGEFGQGTFDALPKIVAEELDADWNAVEVILSGEDPRMANPAFNRQLVGGSMAVRGYFAMLRQAGAAAREMLVAAAADRLGVTPDAIETRDSFVTAAGQRLSYGSLAAAAAALPVPQEPKWKSRKTFGLLGRDLPRKETGPKIVGEAVYAVDIELAGMLHAAMAMPDACWGAPVAHNVEAVEAMPGVHAVRKTLGGFVVVADTYWDAQTAAKALDVTIADDDETIGSSAQIDAAIDAALADEPAVANFMLGDDGEKNLAASRASIARRIDTAATQVEAHYAMPMVAHGALEPLACTARFDRNRLEMWVGHQAPGQILPVVETLTGLKAEAVTIHRTFMGGGFGRKGNVDFVEQAVTAAIAVPGRPVKLIWTREQDTRHDFYRPAYKARLRMGLDAEGRIVAFENRVAAQSLAKNWFPTWTPDGPDLMSQRKSSYRLPHQHLESRAVDLPMPIGSWRAVTDPPTDYFMESMMNEAAEAAGIDPIAFRIAHHDDPRAIRVLERLGAYLGTDREGVGVALATGYDTYCATAAKVRLEDNVLTVESIHAVVDCGFALEPENVRRQIQGGMFYGLGPALDGAILFENRIATASNIHDIGATSPFGAPKITVDLLDSDDKPGGVGEAGVSGVAPALCAAIAAAGGPRVRILPVANAGIGVTV